MDAQALLVTATLPDTAGGIAERLWNSEPPLLRCPAMEQSGTARPAWLTADSTDCALILPEGRSVAVILNTIRDACDVYRKI